jgi:2-amino-4-hydroxy-6-hydroxymethyldihydropteridine diphosphokinase
MSTFSRHRHPTSTTWSGWRTATAGSEARAPVWLGLGSNQGDRRANLAAALNRLANLGRIEAVSDVHETEPVGVTDQPEFWNLAIRIRTNLEPADLLSEVKTIEAALGREPGVRWGPRPIDIDILLYEDRIIDDERLHVPHPRMLERGFVLRPLMDIDPDLTHPTSGARIAEVLAAGMFERSRRLFSGTLLQEDS